MKKFDEVIKELTKLKYPYIRFVRAEYSVSANKLTIFFLIRYDKLDDGSFSDKEKAEINSACATLLPDEITFIVKYVKACADVETVRTKFLQYLSKREPIICQQLQDDSIDICVEESYISISVISLSNINSIINDESFKENLLSYLYENFVEDITLNFCEKYVDDTKKAQIIEKIKENFDKHAKKNEIFVNDEGVVIKKPNAFDDLFSDNEETIVISQNARLVNLKTQDCLFGNRMPTSMPCYITDIKDSYEHAVICGTVSSVRKLEYANKNFNKVLNPKARFKPNTKDEKLARYVFNVNDTTGTFPVICFPQCLSSEKLDTFLTDGATVVCEGKLKVNNYEEFQMTADCIWLADIDFSSINAELPKMRENANYRIVFPEKYRESVQASIDDLEHSIQIPAYLRGKTFVAFDLETTGLDVRTVSIVQIGAVKIADGKIVETFHSLVNPMCAIPPETTKIHGITDDMVVSAPEFSDILPDFYKFTRGCTLVGQNLFGYDLPILNRLAKDGGYVFDNPTLDTLIIAKQHINLPRYNLDMLCKHFGVILVNAHSADADALATSKCFMKLAEKL